MSQDHTHTCPLCEGTYECTDPAGCVSPREVECAACISAEGVVLVTTAGGAR